jgi:hypothetical protein
MKSTGGKYNFTGLFFRLYNIQKYQWTGMIKYMLLFIPLPFGSLRAQIIGLRASTGFYTGSSLRASQGRFIFGNGVCYSAGLSATEKIKKQKDIRFELQYLYASSHWYYERYDDRRKLHMGNMTIHTLLVGAGKNFGKGRVQPYGVAMLGAAFFVPDSLERVKRWTFSFSFATGLKMAITPTFGINLQVLASLPLMYNRVYVGWEPNIGLATEVAPAGILFTGYLTGGVYCNLMQ